MPSNNPFMSLSYAELDVLQRMCRSARFGQTFDPDIMTSQQSGEIHKQVIAAQMAAGFMEQGTDVVIELLNWLQVDSSRDEWKLVVAHYKKDDLYSHWSPYNQYRNIEIAMLPFELSEKQVYAMIAEITNQTTK